MDRTVWRALIGGSLIALLLGSGLLSADGGARGPRTANAEEDQDTGGETPASAKGIKWALSWEDARRRAKAENKLVFAYFGRHNPG